MKTDVIRFISDIYMGVQTVRNKTNNTNTYRFPSELNDKHNSLSDFYDVMFIGIPYFQNFLEDPIKYCNENKPNIYHELYFEKPINGLVYKIINNVDVLYSIIIHVNLSDKKAMFIVENNENVHDQIGGQQEISIKNFEMLIENDKNFFKEELDLLNKYNKEYSEKDKSPLSPENTYN